MRHLLPLGGLLLVGLSALGADPLDDRAAQPAVATRLVNAEEMRRKLALLPDFAAAPRLKDVKVAVLDSGFAGIDGKRSYLPKATTVVEHYDREFVRRFGLGDPEFVRPFTPGDAHGRAMAQIVWAMTGNAPDGPQFYLLNANGPTMFRRAVRYAVEQKVDVILFSGTFEGAGNYDGRGPINAAVDAATAAGILWVNAAGNCGGRVYNGPVDVGPDGFLRFRDSALPSALRFTNRFDENAVTVTLTWNDYRDTEDAGTDKDLDLIVEDATGRVVGQSQLKQVPAGRATGDGETKNPRERLVLSDLPAVPAGQEYRIRVKANGNRFGPRDRVRILLSAAKAAPFTDPQTGKTASPVELLDASKGGEIYPPADHPGVLTVGDSSRFSSIGPTADGRVKPDVVLSSSVARFSNGEESDGSSNAAAYFTGVVAVMRAQEPGLTTGHVREWVRRLDLAGDSKRAAADVPPPLPSAFPPGLPPPPGPGVTVLGAGPRGVAFSPNQQRALRYAEGSMEDNRRQRGLPPYIVMSTPGGTYLVQPGGQLFPGDAPPSTPRLGPPPPIVTRARAQVPVDEPQASREPHASREPPHAAWITPSPKALADLVRGP